MNYNNMLFHLRVKKKKFGVEEGVRASTHPMRDFSTKSRVQVE